MAVCGCGGTLVAVPVLSKGTAQAWTPPSAAATLQRPSLCRSRLASRQDCTTASPTRDRAGECGARSRSQNCTLAAFESSPGVRLHETRAATPAVLDIDCPDLSVEPLHEPSRVTTSFPNAVLQRLRSIVPRKRRVVPLLRPLLRTYFTRRRVLSREQPLAASYRRVTPITASLG